MADIRDTNTGRDTNPDPITGEPGSHPVGVGVGAAGGGATGAAIGMAVGGPIGGAVGAIVGALAGGLAGKGVAEAVDPTAEDAYWRSNHGKQPFVKKDHDYDDYAPAYRTGFAHHHEFEPGTPFEKAEPTLRERYEKHHSALSGAPGLDAGSATSTGMTPAAAIPTPATTHISGSHTGSTGSTGSTGMAKPKLAWDEVKHATKAAWDRVERGEAIKVPISEEKVHVAKREVEAGAVRLRKEVHTEVVNQPVELRREEITVERVAAGTPGSIPADAFQEGEIRVPIKQEEAVVSKTAEVTGEVHIRKSVEHDTENVRETVRKEEVRVENDDDLRNRKL